MNKYIIIIILLFTNIVTAQNIGVNTTPADDATLDVNGDMRIGEINPTKDSTLPIVVDTDGYLYKTGNSEAEISTLIQDEEDNGAKLQTKRPFISLRIKARTNSMDEDKISNLDTKIDADKYTVMLMGCYFRYPAWDLNQVPRNEKHYAIGLTPNKKAPQLETNTFIEDGTWRIKADYVGGTPVYDYFAPDSYPEQRYFYWDINLLVVKNIYMKDIGLQKGETTYSTGYGYVGSAEKNPLP